MNTLFLIFVYKYLDTIFLRIGCRTLKTASKPWLFGQFFLAGMVAHPGRLSERTSGGAARMFDIADVRYRGCDAEDASMPGAPAL
jgi:hypothetical protein